MAPTENLHAQVQRRYCTSGSYYSNGRCYSNSNWYYWGRWVLTGIIILFFVLLLFVLSRRVRRQRRQGARPAYGTNWMGWGQNQQPQYNNAQNYAAPPPQYTPQPPPGNPSYTGNSNEGYYGHNTGTYNNDIPLQQPSNSYHPTRGANEDYAPPEGPPPAKK